MTAKPFGMRFAEVYYTSEGISDLDLIYDEDANYTLIRQGDQRVPFVISGMSCNRTQTITENSDEPEDGENENISSNIFMLTQTSTRASGDEPEDGEDENRVTVASALLTQTETKNAPEQPDEFRENGYW